MNVATTDFDGLYIIKPKVITDNRGYFMESYNERALKEHGVDCEFVQDNHSKSRHGVLRGLHFQNPPFAQAKLIRAVAGVIWDVVVDIRKSSDTYGKIFSIELTAENKLQLFVPKGFAHGFSVLSDSAEILYKCDNYYNKLSEGGLRYDDDDLNINWRIQHNKLILSDKDKMYPAFKNFQSQFV